MTLKEATSEKHSIAEKMPFNQIMIMGGLSPAQYLEYLKVQYCIFNTIESRLLLPIDLIRSGNISRDIHELSNSLGVEIKIPITSSHSKKYVNHLLKIPEKDLWAHVYLNYFAIIFGGQMIKSKVRGSGRMYDFENIQDNIKFIREKQSDSHANEVNKGYDFMIDIFENLHKSLFNV